MAGPALEPVAVVGLGLMGGVMAQHLLDAGHQVIGYDPDRDRSQQLIRAAANPARFTVASSVARATAEPQLVLCSLPNSEIMLEVCRQMVTARPVLANTLLIDTTTGDPADSLAAAGLLKAAGGAYVDATISGNSAQAADKDLIFMVGGSDADVARAKPVLATLGRQVHHVGAVASGSRAKLVVNHVLAVNRAVLAEGLTVAEQAGVDLEPMLEILRDSAAYSKAMDIWGRRMVAGDHYPPNSRIRQNHKDLRLITGHAATVGASADLVDVVRQILVEAEGDGLSDADNSAIMEVMRRRAGIGRLATGVHESP